MVRSAVLALVVGLVAVSAQAATIYVDPTGNSSSTGDVWNDYNVGGTSAATLTAQMELVDSTGAATGIYIEETDSFSTDPNGAGSAPTEGSDAYEFLACGTDSTFGSTDSSRGCATPQLTFTGLTAGVEYTFTMYVSRTGLNDRSTTMTLTSGTSTDSATLLADNNTTEVVSATVTADSTGTIVLDLTGNDQYWYFNAFKITYTDVPEPATMSLLGLGGLAAVLRRRRR